ncbi:hypothetical protein PybrP1_004940 [[Pythium] brassicae (nom. inval.)]|nr:hypothetical protein PybrP1_004940 [[Pythium] brassicae (nom. inval.)]
MDEVLLAVESSDALVARLVAFCDQNDVDRKYRVFHTRHAHVFDGAGDSEDDKSHEVYRLFQEYEKLFEATIGEFLAKEQLSPEDFYNHCRRLLASPRHEDAASNLEILLSALDFDAFCELMTAEALETHSALAAAADMGL